MLNMNNRFLFAALFIVFISCTEDPSTTPLVLKGNRAVGYHITNAADEDYETAFQVALDAGMDVVPITLLLEDLFKDGEWHLELPQVIDLFYPANNMPVCLNLTPVAAVEKSLPDHLDYTFNDVEFHDLLLRAIDTIAYHTPNVQMDYFMLGNEIDLYLNQHPDEWDGYIAMYEKALLQVKKHWPEAKVGVENTLSGYKGDALEKIKQLNKNSDLIAFSYYPLDADFNMQDPSVLSQEFEFITGLFPNRKLLLEETGYASGSLCGSSNQLQNEFYQQFVKEWDQYAETIEFVGFLWLTDLPEAEADHFVDMYQMTGNVLAAPFKEFLRTTALRTYANGGTEKPAFTTLKQELKNRGWSVK